MDKREIYAGFVIIGLLTYNLTKNHYILKNRISLLENNTANLKERLSDLELFKLKVYNNEISIGRRVWEDDMDDEEVNLDLDLE
jgi:hypothetical protein|tara:strand:+ start:1085 stop:1336 length:252 start_codon:yes stop_codon:yes gene_type:complete